MIRSPVSSGPLSRLSLTVDYFNIKINDPIGNSGGGGVLQHCIDSQFNPSAQALLPARRMPASSTRRNPCPGTGSDPAVDLRQVYRTPSNASANQFGTFDAARVITTLRTMTA